MNIEIDSRWLLTEQTNRLPTTQGGAFAFGGKQGSLFLPKDYLGFLQRFNGGSLWRGRSWFVAQFKDGGRQMQVDSISNVESMITGSMLSFAPGGLGRNYLPPNLVNIGFDAITADVATDIWLKADPSAPDHVHVFVWFYVGEEWMTGENTEGLGYVAPSFTAFMNGLRDENKF